MAIRLTTSTLNNMRGNTSLLRKIAIENDLNTLETIRRWMRQNKGNGPLTSISTLRIISEAINVPESKLVEESKNPVQNKPLNPYLL